MIKIIDVTIDNYRSITGESLFFNWDDYCVIVGQNNSGKSNILRALQLFFKGHVDGYPYNSKIDFPKNSKLWKRSQTSITITFKYSPAKNKKIENAIKYLEESSGQSRLENNLIRIRLDYSKKNIPLWRFVSKAGLRSIRSDLIMPIVDSIRSSIHFKYLPVGRDIINTIKEELSEELINTIFSGWSGAVKTRRDINEAIEYLINKLQPKLLESGNEITGSISSVFDEIKNFELKLPFNNLENMLPSLIPSLKDRYETPLN